MTLLELNKIFDGKFAVDSKKEAYSQLMTKEDFINFRELLNISDTFINALKATDCCTEFFEKYELLDRLIKEELKEDVFYSAKLGFYYEGIPSKLVYILQKAIRKYSTPNNAISSIDIRAISKYFKKNSLPEGVSMKQVMENLLGIEFTLLSESCLSTTFREYMEIYVANTDRVLIVPLEMSQFFGSREDLENIRYVKNIGVCMYDIPIRTFGGRVGLTVNEYDLRECR